ncbi:MAG TPA: DUF192 domain-containing protein [Acidimicrobiia bacterium]|nr:DUF192 domain-containing protein [Acidimicrobiia bacterium]
MGGNPSGSVGEPERRRGAPPARALWLILLLPLVLTACANPDGLMSDEETDALVTTTVTPGRVDRGDVSDAFALATIDVSGRSWIVAVADDANERYRGLRQVADLGDLDGMLFVYDEDSTSTFGMFTVPIPLEIAWFDAEGRLVDRATMAACPVNPCVSYEAADAYRYAVETVEGGFDGLDPLTLTIDP